MDLSYYHFNILANLIISRYYHNTRCLLIFVENERIFNYQGSMPSVQIKIVNNSFDSSIVFKYYGCQGVVIQSDSPHLVFGEVEKAIRLNMERFNRRRYLLLSSEGNLDVFDMVELNYVVDLLVVVPDEENFELLTHKYVGTNASNTPMVLDAWMVANQSFVYDSDLYPNKFSNQHGRAFKMATIQYEPYSVIGDSVSNYLGSELSTATHFSLKYNMTPIPVVNQLDYWGEIYSNWTGTGILGSVVLDNADVGFGSLETWESTYHYLDLSRNVVRTAITCLVPAPRLAAGWLEPLLSYTPQIWICVVVLYVSGVVLLSLIQHCHSRNFFLREVQQQNGNNTSFMKVLGTSAFQIARHFLLQAVGKSEIPVEFNGKCVMVLLVTFSLILTITYSSGLASILAIPRYEDAIQTTDDFIRSGISWGATGDAWIFSISTAEDPKNVAMVNRFVAESEEVLRENSLGGQFGLAIERLPFNNFAIGTYIQKDVIGNYRLMQEDIYREYSVMVLRKNSVLLPYLNAFILRAFQGGLINKWQSTAVQLSMDSDVQKAVISYTKNLHEHEIDALKLTDFEGAFAILILGWLVSSVVFLCELIKTKIDNMSRGLVPIIV